MSRLKLAGIVFIATWLVHSADHLRRGVELTPEGVIWGGTFVGIFAAVALTLVFTEHPAAALTSAVVFPAIALGVTASHLAPDWGYFSEPLIFDSATDMWAPIAATPEIIAAAWLGWVAWGMAKANNFQIAKPAAA